MRDTGNSRNQWYAVYTQLARERQAAAALEALLGLTAYLPEIRQHDGTTTRHIPYFARYFFVTADLQRVAPSAINATPGVGRLVMFDGVPLAIPAAVMTALRERVSAINARGGIPDHGFHPGDTVRIRSGPLRGLEAIFQGPMEPSRHARVLLDFLGSLRPTMIETARLERASSPPPKIERRTRGRGRPIKRSQSS
jgi:transcriptional antiterminator RfaH